MLLQAIATKACLAVIAAFNLWIGPAHLWSHSGCSSGMHAIEGICLGNSAIDEYTAWSVYSPPSCSAYCFYTALLNILTEEALVHKGITHYYQYLSLFVRGNYTFPLFIERLLRSIEPTFTITMGLGQIRMKCRAGTLIPYRKIF
jgi:hypothetical protein